MKEYWLKLLVSFSIVLSLGYSCSRSESDPTPKGPVVLSKTETESEQQITINPDELIDRTVRETVIEKPGYSGNNGTLLLEKNDGEARSVFRKFILTFGIKDYSLSSERKLFPEPSIQSDGILYADDSLETMQSDQLLVRFTPNEKSPERWLKVVVSDGRSGWWFVGSGDPYSEHCWAVVRTITIEDKTMSLLKFDSMFSTRRGELAYDRPSRTDSLVLWKAEPTANNDQINLVSLLVTDETFQGKYWSEHWVKVRDAYGRIGWFPGDTLDVERGGFKYNSPENLVRYAFYEP